MTLRGFLAGLGVVGVCALFSAGFFLFYSHATHIDAMSLLSDFPGYKTKTIEIGGQRIHIAVADTPALQELGLGTRSGLGVDEGMLFVFPVEKKYAFWMKDMHFPIDMIWISGSGSIVSLAKEVSPDTYPHDFIPTAPARYVLEVVAGYAAAHGFNVGDTVRL